MSNTLQPDRFISHLEHIEPIRKYGKVTQVIGLTIESNGPEAGLGEICLIYPHHDALPIEAEVVGFKQNRVLLMPLSDVGNVGPGSLVLGTGAPLQVKVGTALLGQVLDGRGNPLDGSTLPKGLKAVSTNQSPPNPMDRPRIKTPLGVGIRANRRLINAGAGTARRDLCRKRSWQKYIDGNDRQKYRRGCERNRINW